MTIKGHLISNAAPNFCPFKGGYMAANYLLKLLTVLGPNACRFCVGDDSLDFAEVIHFLLASGTIVYVPTVF